MGSKGAEMKRILFAACLFASGRNVEASVIIGDSVTAPDRVETNNGTKSVGFAAAQVEGRRLR